MQIFHNNYKNNIIIKKCLLTLGKSIYYMSFFHDLNSSNLSGVAYKNLNIKKTVIRYFSIKGYSTISDLSKEIALSTPKVNNILTDLIEDGLVKDYGKLDSKGGRRPNTYGLVSDSAFFIGVDIKQDQVILGISDLQKNIIKIVFNEDYILENTAESLDKLCDIIKNFIKDSGIPKNKVLGIGINLIGRINHSTGHSYSFFHFQEEPLSKILQEKVGINVFLENDSRAMAYGEFALGVVKDEKNVLFLNLDHGIGMGVMINREIYYGKSGFAGEFGHIPIYDNEIICHCGKKGCLETEAAGWALIRKFKEKIKDGSSSLIKKDADKIRLNDIIYTAQNDDNLAIELIGEVGERIGRGIAILVNLFNPELIILGGLLSETEEYLQLPLKTALNKSSLSIVNTDTQIKLSKLQNKAGVIGACLIARNRILDLS